MNINPSGFLNRYFTIFSVLHKNHYDALGITPKATQSEIKTAYYKLSMIFHPDRNKGSETANDKFRDITAAYEVLGNVSTRRLYDRGLSGMTAEGFKSWGTDDSKDITIKGSRIPTARGTYSGRTPIYDFDEWSRFHYGQTLERRAEAKARYNEKMKHDYAPKANAEKENIMLSVFMLTSVFLIFSYAFRTTLDAPIEKSNNSK